MDQQALDAMARAANRDTSAGSPSGLTEEIRARIKANREEAIDRRNKLWFKKAVEAMDRDPALAPKVGTWPVELNFHNCPRHGQTSPRIPVGRNRLIGNC